MFFKKRRKEKEALERRIKQLEALTENLIIEDKYLRAAVLFLSKYNIKDVVFSIEDDAVKIEYFTNIGYTVIMTENPKIIDAVKDNKIQTGRHTEKEVFVFVDDVIYCIDKKKQTIIKIEDL